MIDNMLTSPIMSPMSQVSATQINMKLKSAVGVKENGKAMSSKAYTEILSDEGPSYYGGGEPAKSSHYLQQVDEDENLDDMPMSRQTTDKARRKSRRDKKAQSSKSRVLSEETDREVAMIPKKRRT